MLITTVRRLSILLGILLILVSRLSLRGRNSCNASNGPPIRFDEALRRVNHQLNLEDVIVVVVDNGETW